MTFSMVELSIELLHRRRAEALDSSYLQGDLKSTMHLTPSLFPLSDRLLKAALCFVILRPIESGAKYSMHRKAAVDL